MKDSTRAKSSKQEKRIAKAIGGRQVVGSGSTPFLKGDVIAGDLFIEAKTKMNPSQSITVKKSWIDKAKMVVVDGEKIKEDTYYRCIEGEIVEVTEDGEIVEE